MNRKLLTGNGAAAWGARLARIDYLPAFPITPQTEIIETLGSWIENGELECRMVTMESEHSMLTAAGAAAVAGVRVFTATSSQGLLYATEMLYTVAGWRVPLVLVNVSRGLSSPITLEPDHNDVLAMRDCGFLQLHCATCQEVLDNLLIAYRLAEHPGVRLPVLVNLDGFYLSFTREPVRIPAQTEADRFLSPFNAGSIRMRGGESLSEGVAVLDGSTYSYFRYEAHLASLQGLAVYEELGREFGELFGRSYSALECYLSEDAEIVFVMIGSFATKAKEAVDRLREAGEKAGLVRPRLLRPLPAEALRQALAGKKGVAVIDQNLSPGKGGILQAELASVLYGMPNAPPVLASFVGGLGGRDISSEEFFEIHKMVQQAVAAKVTPEPRLLYTEEELRAIRKMQSVACVHRNKQGGGT
jgi:pyruvate ferredoxin oxidoreductase alpha subunit